MSFIRTKPQTEFERRFIVTDVLGTSNKMRGTKVYKQCGYKILVSGRLQKTRNLNGSKLEFAIRSCDNGQRMKEPTLLFVKSRRRRPRWCGTTFHGLGGQ